MSKEAIGESLRSTAEMTKNKALLLLSGGQDSFTLFYWAKKQFASIEALSFNYGQRHLVELEAAKELCEAHEVPHSILELSCLKQISKNALVNSEREISLKGDYQGLPSTFVPGRNALFLTLGASYALPRSINEIVIGACETDYSGYPDCREEFIASMEQSLSLAMANELKIHRPLMFMDKAQTFAMASELEVLDDVIKKSHTCYKGTRDVLQEWGYGCGECPACVLRKNGFKEFKGEVK